MPQIVLDSIQKTFRVAKRPPGLLGAIRGAFVRNYNDIKALDGISFTIDEGELVGYIGPNGAGKSTTVKIMGGILVPDSGRCEIMGRIPWKERTIHVAHIGVVFGQRSQLWWDLPVMDSFHLLRDIYCVREKDFRNRLDELIAVLDLSSLLSTPVRQLSLGQRMRAELAAALIHHPRILFLDEPTIGLDAVAKLALRQFLREMNQKYGVTMILTTHDMDDIETLCERVMVIGHGSILFDDSLERLRKRYAPQRRIRAKLAESVPLTHLPGTDRLEVNGTNCVVHFNPERIPAHQLVASLAATCPLLDVVVEDLDIDTMIARMYKELQL